MLTDECQPRDSQRAFLPLEYFANNQASNQKRTWPEDCQTIINFSMDRMMRNSFNLLRGALIVLEGCDGTGKSTQAKMLVNALRILGFQTESHSFPNRLTETGKVINEYLICKKYLPSETAHLLFSANRWECIPEIRRVLETGTTIVLDRYAASGAAYGVTNTGRDLDWCKNPDKGLPAPDIVVYLQKDTASQEPGNCGRGERFEFEEFQEKVAKNYLDLADDTWLIVENGSIDDTHMKILEVVTKVLANVRDTPIKKLYE